MKAEELRIGNLFQDKYSKDIFKVLELSKGVIVFDYVNMENWQAESIILTEEWLFKFGFKKSEAAFTNKIFIRHPFKGKFEIRISDGLRNLEIKYVHQLQNLYFSIIGEELQYDI